MIRLPRLRPDGLAVRFTLLLAGALIVANLVAAGLLHADRERQRDARQIEREVERIVSLVPAIEAAPETERGRAARAASTKMSRISFDPDPIVTERPVAPRSARLSRELGEALGPREVRAAIMIRRAPEGAVQGGSVALSIRLSDGSGWLNTVSRQGLRPPPGIPREVLALVLGVSLVSVLGVAVLFLQRLTRPLKDLSAAAHLAGQGDRAARVTETGPREVREAARAFNAMQARIASFDAERMRTLAAIGHDLRTPITSLRIRAEMLDEDEAEPMIRTLDEMTVMADGLVAYARGAGDAEQRCDVDLAELLTRLCEDRGAALRVEDPATVSGRKVALGRAIGNVIDNALRYGGGARVALSRARGKARITVEDDGPGIPPDRLDSVLEPFVRGEDSRSADTGGAGLGLSIARTILTAHGGSLRLENRDEGGLRVVITLPGKTPAKH